MNRLSINRLTAYKWSLMYDGLPMGHIIADPMCDVIYTISIFDGYSCTIDSGFWSAITRANDECNYIIDRLIKESEYITNSDYKFKFSRKSIYELDIFYSNGRLLSKLIYDTRERVYTLLVGAYFDSELCKISDINEITNKLNTYLESVGAWYDLDGIVINERLQKELKFITDADTRFKFKRQSIYAVDVLYEDHVISNLIYDSKTNSYTIYVGADLDYAWHTFEDLNDIGTRLDNYMSSAKSRFDAETVIIDLYNNS